MMLFMPPGGMKLKYKPKVKSGFKPLKKSELLKSSLIQNLPATKVTTVVEEIDKGTFDPERGEEQFSSAEQTALNEAIASGDYTALPAKLKAFLDFQVAQRQDAITQQIVGDADLLAEIAKQEQEKQLAEQKALAEAQAKRAKQQMILYGVVGLGGLGLIYYMTQR